MKTLIKVGIITYIVIIGCLISPILAFILLVVGCLIIAILFMGGINTMAEENNGKDGYYSQVGTSFGANADKHNKYLEHKISNEIMKD